MSQHTGSGLSPPITLVSLLHLCCLLSPTPRDIPHLGFVLSGCFPNGGAAKSLSANEPEASTHYLHLNGDHTSQVQLHSGPRNSEV